MLPKADNALKKAREECSYKYLLFPVSKARRVPRTFNKAVFEGTITYVEGKPVADFIEKPLKNLLLAAREKGHKPYIRSAYRSINEQNLLFDRFVKELIIEENYNLTPSQAKALVNKESSRGGYSEHHLGTAVDILDENTKDQSDEFEYARQGFNQGLYAWLRNNAQLFGFVISYPTGTTIKEAISGSGYEWSEPWHLRYVTAPIAQLLYTQGYLDPKNQLTLNKFLLWAWTQKH